MAERLGALPDDPKQPLLPVSADDDAAPPSSSPDLLSKFLAAREARPDFMSDTLVQTMAVSMAFAGSETTAISLGAVFYYLLRHPAALARLRAELDDAARAGAFADATTGLVTWHESQRLPYLDACIKEAFRLHPAAGLPLERIVPPAGADIAGHHVPGGTIVGCSAWVIHRRPELWGADADAYRPERWLVDERLAPGSPARAADERRVREMNGHMFQFGMGSRTCIGKNISLLEIYKLVPSFLRRFEVRLPSPPAPYILSMSFPLLVPAPSRKASSPSPPQANHPSSDQIRFKDPQQEWKLINAWFVKQVNFQAVFEPRELVKPDGTGQDAEKKALTHDRA